MKVFFILFLGIKEGFAARDLASYDGNAGIASQVLTSLVRGESGRKMQSVCSTLEPAAEEILMSFNCDCSREGSSFITVCNSPGEICCDDKCGRVKQTLSYSNDFNPEWEESCVSYSSGSFDGKEVCHQSYYSGATITSCRSNVDGTTCNSCDVCGSIPGLPQGIQFAVPNCSNIGGFESIKYSCEDVDTIEEVEALYLLTCANNSASIKTQIATYLAGIAGLVMGVGWVLFA